MATTTLELIDESLEVLSGNADQWLSLPIGERIEYLRRVAALTMEHAAEWVEQSVAGKQLEAGSPYVGEEWSSGPSAAISWINACIDTLESLASGDDPLENIRIGTTANGQVSARIYPTNLPEALLLHGYEVHVWMEDDVSRGNIRDTIGVAYKNPPAVGQVALVLGAGNISSIPALDLLYKLFADLEVVVLKFNPVNEYLGAVFEKIFEPLISDGYLRFVYGGGDVGAQLTEHVKVDTIHITGNQATHDTIVFGSGDAGEQRRAENRPRLTKPITSELGGVSPVIVVPGPWTRADVAYQAEHIATQRLHNSGFNCIAAQVMVLPEDWAQADALMVKVAETIDSADDRVAYYPGAEQRGAAAIADHDGAEPLGVEGRRVFIPNVDASQDEACFTDEFFAPVLASTRLPATSAKEYLSAAVEFANERLHGTLGANIIVHPDTIRELGPDLEKAIHDLNYGTVAVNAWTAVGYLLQRAPWGAARGHTLDDAQSGIGVVHNALLLDRTQKTVVRAPFQAFPRTFLNGEFSMSPKPFWFVTHKTARQTAERFTHYLGDDRLSRLPGIFAAALRG